MQIFAFEEYLVGLGLSDRSVAEYRKFGRRLHLWTHRNDIALEDLTAVQIRAWSNELPKSWASRKQARTAVGHLMRFLEKDDTLARAVQVPRKPRSRNRALTMADAARLRDAAMLAGGRAGTAVMIALHTGARRSEIAAMQWSGINLEREWIRWEGVKGSDPGDMPLHPDLAAMLARLDSHEHSAYVFPGDRGRAHVRPETVWTWVREVAELAGLDRVATHRLRHTSISAIYQAGLDPKAAQEFARHRDLSVTSIYIDQPVEAMHKAVRGLWSDEQGTPTS